MAAGSRKRADKLSSPQGLNHPEYGLQEHKGVGEEGREAEMPTAAIPETLHPQMGP